MSNKPQDRDAQGNLVRFITRQGRGVLIYRQYKSRGEGRVYSAAWTRRVVRNAKQYFFNLGTQRDKAAKAADELEAFLRIPGNTIAMAIVRFAPDKLEKPSRGKERATIGDVLEVFEEARLALDLSGNTATGYKHALLWFVRYVQAARRGRKPTTFVGSKYGNLDEVMATPVSFLDRAAVDVFKTAMVKEAAGNPALEQKKKRSANSTLRNAKAVFSDAAREKYAHLKLPDISGFLLAKPFRKVTKRYVLPAPEVIRAIFADLPQLRDGDEEADVAPDPNAYIAALLALCAGLRWGEIAHARRTWLREKEGAKLKHRINVQAEDDFSPKARETGYAELTDWAFREVLETSYSTPYLLEGNESERTDRTVRRLNAWLRARGLVGLDRDNPTHELRKLFGSWVATTFDLFTAKTWCRHASIRTTEDYYADLIVSPEVLKLWDPNNELAKRSDAGNAGDRVGA